jgi:alpha-beta hydrolase superfamily lysophospholipase
VEEKRSAHDECGWFETPSGPLFGVISWPLPGSVGTVGAVLCPPVGLDLQFSYAGIRSLAHRMASKGLVTIRFDYSGTGNSSGSLDDSRLSSWVSDVKAAIAVLKNVGVEHVVLVGLRLGANLAAAVMQDESRIDSVVLWDPYWNGGVFLREQRLLLTMGGEEPTNDQRMLEIAGYVIGNELRNDILSLNLEDIDVCGLPTLLYGRRTVARAYEKRGSIADAHVVVEVLDEASAVDMLAPTDSTGRLPHQTLDRIVEWVLRQHTVSMAPAEVTEGILSAHISIVQDGQEVQEESFRFGDADLFGIRTSSHGATAKGLAVLFISSADGHNIGPSRLWVDLARSLAVLGISSLRFDLSGIGESDAEGDWPESLVYVPTAVRDVRTAFLVAGQDESLPVVPVGLCSGGYLAVEAVAAFDVPGFIVFNAPFHMRLPEQRVGPVDPQRKLAIPRRKMFYSASRRMIDARLSSGSPNPKRWQGVAERIIWRILDITGIQRSPMRSVVRLARLGRRGRMIYGSDEMVTLRRGARKRWFDYVLGHHIAVQEVGHLNHGLWDLGSRRLVTTAIEEDVRQLERSHQ